MPNTKLKPYIDFYSKHNISPVHQDITDMEKHFQRRESLYRSLSVIPNLLEGKSILELGPGSGHNAIYTASLNPKHYVLVDGNKRGIFECKSNLNQTGIEPEKLEFHHSLIEDFQSDEIFDIVIAEGFIPYQLDPVKLLRHVSKFCKKKGGVLLITSNSAVGILSEIIRKFAKYMLFEQNENIEDKLTILRPLFEPQLKTLKGMNRPVDDWLLDNIIQSFPSGLKLLNMPDAINSLADDFDILGTSPKFITDWRWYKDIVDGEFYFNKIAIENYYRKNLNLMDYRFVFPEHDKKFGLELETMCSEVWEFMCSLESGTITSWNPVWGLLQSIKNLIKPIAYKTAESIDESMIWLKNINTTDNNNKLYNHFFHWWGRGHNYISFIRR